MHNHRRKLFYVAWIALFCFAVVYVKYFYIQIIQSHHWQEQVVSQRVKNLPQTPQRGTITDRNGDALALSLVTKNVDLFPKFIEKKEEQEKLAQIFTKYLGVDYEKTLKVLESDAEWANIAKRVDIKVAEQLEAALKKEGIGGVKFLNSSKRYYPNGNLGASVLGFVNSENIPGAGIEISMDSYLAGVPGYVIAETYPDGRSIPIGFENNASQINGQKLTLSIDSYIQYILEKRVAEGMEEMDAKGIHAIVMNPNTGEILGMTSAPTYDPRDYEAFDKKTWTNNPAAFVYEPGSTFKPVYMAMAMEGKHINPSSTFYDGAGAININGTWIKNWNRTGLGQATLEDIIVNSSNVGMIQISQTMTNKQIVEGMKKAGFGQKTGIDIPGEESGLFPTVDQLDNDPLMKATVAFGQGIGITPIQLVTAFSEVINGGYKVKPTLVLRAEDEFENIHLKTDLSKKDRLYSEETSKALKGYLKTNMEIGSGKDYQLDQYEGGGKTGSAWVVENGRYKDGAIIGSFIGFAPFEDPELTMLVVVDEPKTTEFGGPAAGPIFHDVMQEALRYMNVGKERDHKPESAVVAENVEGDTSQDGETADTPTSSEEREIKVPKVIGKTLEDAQAILKKDVPNVVVKQEGAGEYVERQTYRQKGSIFTVTLHTRKIVDDEAMHLPDLIGKTEKEVKSLLKGYKMDVKFRGEGKVVEQSESIGRHKKGTKLTIWLQ